REAAEEEFEHQLGGASPIPMPLGDKHFDPEKSATLKFIKEGDEGHFGEHLFEQIASAEAPKVYPRQEPEWAQYAREKSERARSRTPADPSQHYTPSTTPLSTSYYERQRNETPREFLEKSKARGYECGGLDYTKGLHFPSVPNEQYLENRRRRGSDVPHTRTGYELGGTDFGKSYTAPGPYRGHGPDPPRLRSRYSADPRSPCNSYYAPNVDEVDANLLVGDTISNQKISHEVRHINQNEFGTSFAPPPGFKRDHITVRRSPPPPEPVTFSISANKSRYGGSVGNLSSSSYQRQHDMWRQSRTPDAKEVTVQTLLNDDVLKKVDRETTPVWHDRSVSKQEAWRHRTDPLHERNQVFTSEPNWSRTVQERRNAWERKAYDTEARLNLPALAKLPPSQPPAWHSKAARTHNVWQAAADTMNAHVQHSCTQPEHQTYETVTFQSQTTYSSGAHPYRSQSQYEEQQRHQQQQQQRQSYISSERSEDYSSTAQGVPVQQVLSATTYTWNRSPCPWLTHQAFHPFWVCKLIPDLSRRQQRHQQQQQQRQSYISSERSEDYSSTAQAYAYRTIPATTRIYSSDSNKNYTASDVFNRKEDMSETLPLGSISNTHANTQGGYRDQHGHDVSYKREMQTAVDPGKEYALLKEEEKRVVETDLEPGVISRHVTTKYYKKKTVTDTTTTTTPQTQ
ncbi:hypothetical protein Angca_000064, partial [Angiostrongylus cantonensis]